VRITLGNAACKILSSIILGKIKPYIENVHHHHKYQGLDPLIRSVSRVTAGRANASSVFQLFFLLVDIYIYIYIYVYHHHKHQGLDPLIRSVSRVTAARANASSTFQLFFFLVVCSDMISKGFGSVEFFPVKASSVCIHISCIVCL